jgi:hypothetical protein
MKAGRIWLLPMLVLGLLAGVSVSPAAGRVLRPADAPAIPTLALVPEQNPHPPVGIVDVDVVAGGVMDLGAFQMDVLFDPAFLQVEGVTVASFLGQLVACDPNLARCAVPLGPSATASRLRFGAATYGAPAGAGGEGVVAVLHLRPTGTVGATMLSIENAVLADVHAVPVEPEARGATLILEYYGVYLPLVTKE